LEEISAKMSCCCCSGYIIAGVILAIIIAKYFFGKKKRTEKPKIKKEDYKKDVVYLYQFKRAFGLPNMSPYCLKVEAFLRANKIQYEVVEDNFQRGEKGLLPFIELNGEHVADSEFIIQHVSAHFNIKENSSKEVAAAGRAVSRMTDNEISQIQGKFKSKEDEFLKLLLGHLIPGFLVPLAIPIARIMMSKRLRGYGGFSEAELKQLYRKNLQAISDLIGDKKYLGGDTPNLGDFSVFSQIATMYYLPCHNDLNSIVDEYPNVKKVMNAIIREYFADFDVANNLK